MRSRGYVIAIVLIVAIILTQAIATITGVVLATRQVDAAALDTYEYVGDLTAERVARYAESATDVVKGTAVQIGDDTDGTRESLAQAMYQRLEREPSVRGIYVGWATGEYLVVRRKDGGYEELLGGPDGTQQGVLRDGVFREIGDIEALVDYDPRTRPWYQVGAAHSSVAWTDPYIEYDTSNTLVSASQAARREGELLAVVGADLSLERLGRVLDDLPYGEGAEAFVLSPAGEVIAAPSTYLERLREVAAASGEVPTAADIGLTVTEPPTRPGTTEFTRAGSQILLDATFPAQERLDWTIHISAQESQLSAGLGGVGATLWWITAISLVLLAAAAVFAWRVRHPLRRLRERALTDPLTGLTNRSELMRRGGIVVAAAATRGDRVMVTTIDLDRFKQLNDNQGHDVGDRALIAVAFALRACVRDGDIVARLGGDEFVTVQVLRSRDAGRTVATRVRDEVERELHTRLSGAEDVGVTMGIAVATDGGTDLTALLKLADMALIRGKQTAKGRVYDAAAEDHPDSPAAPTDR